MIGGFWLLVRLLQLHLLRPRHLLERRCFLQRSVRVMTEVNTSCDSCCHSSSSRLKVLQHVGLLILLINAL